MSIYDSIYDVVVSGGGVSGCATAVSAARNGAKVLLIERAGYLGGTLTDCGVGPMLTFHAGDKQVIKGIMQEVVDRLIASGASLGHLPDTKQYVDTLTAFQAEDLKLVLDTMLEEADCQVLFHTVIGSVVRQGEHIQSILACNKDGINPIKGRIFIDATGDADLAAWSGVPMTKGRESDGAAQPMTMMMKYANVNTQAVKAYMLAHLDEFPGQSEALLKKDIPIDLEGFAKQTIQEKESGRLSMRRENILMHETNRPGEFLVNTSRILDKDGTDAVSLSEAEKIGRKQCVELDRLLRKVVPGFENALLEFTGPSVGVRSSRQLVGAYTLTTQDVLQCRKFASAIAHSAYPIDVHNPSGEGTDSTFLKRGMYYDIPYECLYSPDLANLLVVGRCISATFEAQAAIRVTPTAGAVGQAGGAAAMLAVKGMGDVRTIDHRVLQKLLIEQGAYIDISE